MKNWFRRQDRGEGIAHDLYVAAVAQARQPLFYVEYGVPDTVDGRFDLIILHVYLFLRQLNQLALPDGESAKSVQAAQRAQSLFDIMFSDMDRSLREMGVSDISIGKRVKHMVKAFYGRAVAYDEGLTGPDTVLRDALERNLFGTVQPSQNQLAAMAEYLRYQADILAKASDQDILAGKLKFATWCRKGVDP